ncbi:hypothetical protein DL766_007851 [Monosporascus sp. MC13-8B]|uniref:Uncharacterized protein n=1 Tax=Monosporascus cannonballus TaxID=155416 RepID=A0ABY0HCF7_9PEZI|nr:hypothetical protein DL763_009943 [Monosporascus cannonballus]RYO87352.1 hypothetical protein DL762_004282 [Monosporascus cannonballus]RYP21868.1 hypothetical protein DL766_007851 [Monosporascus sp. MC13-8B]
MYRTASETKILSSWQGGELVAATGFSHIECFETLADFSKVEYLNRPQPATTRGWGGVPHFGYCPLSGPLARIKSDGSEDGEERDLFEEFMPMDFGDVEGLKDPHSPEPHAERVADCYGKKAPPGKRSGTTHSQLAITL